MNSGSERHERIGDLFDAALELPPEERPAFLDKACAGDAEIRAAVERLLENHSDSGTFLDPLLMRTHAAALLGVIANPGGEPAVIGPYEIRKQLGEGGMGAVYLAHQTQPIERDVALKVIKPGMDSKSVIARFESERRALALMAHPNIAQVFDAGTTDRGLPYFAMELVDGPPITQYCETHKLSIRERIELFIPVCLAIQHAHQKGIIHRDIKPSNVLVSVDEGKPVPKVIDFGLAKALSSDADGATMLMTGIGTVVGTLQYMSPEQAELGSADIDTRSDVYSLGALLYELLTGSPPLDSTRIAKDTYLGILKRIREEEPQAPSARLSSKQLDSELDWIPLKALEKERSRRYETVTGMVKDLQRYLGGEPVEAAPPSRTYRLEKFARRHKSWILTAAAFVLVLVVGIAVSAWMAVRATRAEQEARAISEFLQRDLLGQADPGRQGRQGDKPDPKITVRTAVDRAAARLDGRFKDQPLVEAALRHTIGSVYSNLGLIKQGQGYLRQAVAMRGSLLGEAAEPAIESQLELAKNLSNDGDNPGAEALLTRTLAAARRSLGPGNRLTLQVLNELGWVKYVLGKLDEGIPLLEEGERLATQLYGPHDAATSDIQYRLFANLFAKARYAEAKQVLLKAVETDRRNYGEDSSLMISDYTGLAMIYSQQGLPKEAEPYNVKVLAHDRRVYGLPHPTTLISIYNLAENYTQQGRYAEAEALFRENYKNRTMIYKPDHPRTLLFMSTWANFHTVQNKLAEADAIYAGYLPVLRKTLAEDHPTAMVAQSGLAELRRRQKRYAEAEAILLKNIEAMKRAYGPTNTDTFVEMANLAGVRIEQGRYADAEGPARAASEGLAKVDPERWERFWSRSLLGASLAGQGKDAEADLAAGYEGMLQRKNFLSAGDQGALTEAGQRLTAYQQKGKIR